MKKYIIHFTSFVILILFAFPAFPQSTQSVKLKAILVVGPLEDLTASSIKDMNEIAALLTKNKILVYKFYDKSANWEEIVKVAKDCSFFIYSGHGSKLGENGTAGGLCIQSMVSSAQLIDKLKLKPNALVIFKSVCNGAGSSATDDDDIGIMEAKNRVSSYANPFFKIGASAYYANNYGDGALNFLTDFLAGVPLKKAYLNSALDFDTVEFDEALPMDKNKTYSIASNDGGGFSTRTTYVDGVKKVEKVKSPKEYRIAYVGNSEFSIKNMK